MSDELTLLKERLQTHTFRTDILYFQLISYRMNSRIKFVLNDKNFHLNDCVWSAKDSTVGPDTCHCVNAHHSPEKFFEVQINTPSKLSIIENSTDLKKVAPFQADKDENVNDFYFCRVLDSENICKWYEEYKKKKHFLEFQVQIRELNREKEIDAVFNPKSKEFHLTDCVRSVNGDLGPDTCPCAKAMMSPWKYLKDKYHYINLKKVIEKIKKKETPIRY